MGSVFTLESADRDQIVYFGTQDSEKVFILFTSEDEANRYIALRGMPSDHRPVEIRTEKCVVWLKHANEFDGVTRFILNPDPELTLAATPHYGIDAIIALLQLKFGSS